jgi:nitrite reductase (NADH) small subunit
MNATEQKVTLGPLSLIPAGEGRNFEIAGERIAVFHTRAGQVFATQAACPHKNGPLADGLVGGNIVI